MTRVCRGASAHLAPGVGHDADQQVQKDDGHDKHVEDHQQNGGLRVVAVIEDAELEAADHEVEHSQPCVPDGAELLHAEKSVSVKGGGRGGGGGVRGVL